MSLLRQLLHPWFLFVCGFRFGFYWRFSFDWRFFLFCYFMHRKEIVLHVWWAKFVVGVRVFLLKQPFHHFCYVRTTLFWWMMWIERQFCYSSHQNNSSHSITLRYHSRHDDTRKQSSDESHSHPSSNSVMRSQESWHNANGCRERHQLVDLSYNARITLAAFFCASFAIIESSKSIDMGIY